MVMNMNEELVTGTDRAELLQALARQLEPFLPELRSHLRTTDELASAVASTLAQAVSQIAELLEDDGRAGQVRDSGLWFAWDSYMAQRGRLAGDGEHIMPELRLSIRSESVPGGPTETALGAVIRVAVTAGVRAAHSQPEVTESEVAVLDDSGKVVKRSTVVTKRRAVDA